ncbi:hypothetical protein OIU80_12820 [Flavobacterium sp. LS1R47]|jgi:hypothetical protein|uniref:DUF3052 family protein n=1 Tax=Flavobacterium frigoritolerans TaxID=2987686 RepID=A0A9X2Z0Y1_9FLAO|nr:hypothetical protein [Flavobacterium frigoritolerans]MCV9933169.1 hypothetical protein [Flavobacterium frigoritolerans]
MLDVIKKLKFKDNGTVLNAPKGIKEEFIKLGMKITFDKKTKNTNTLIFINNNQEFLNFLKYDLENIESDSVLWFAYPKGTSKIKTDINRDTIRVTGEEFGLKTVTAISIDETWSALRFRPIDRVGK